MSQRAPFAIAVALTFALAWSAAAQVPAIKSLVPSPAFISPNGDGLADSMRVNYELADTGSVVVMLVLEKDSVTVVDTLTTATSLLPNVLYTAVWHGTDGIGAPVPEDAYVIALEVTTSASTDVAYREVLVDITPPQTVINFVFPPDDPPFAPGLPGQPATLTMEYIVFDSPPSEKVNVGIVLHHPDPDADPETLRPDTLRPVGQALEQTWNGGSAKEDGEYAFEVYADDLARNPRSSDLWTFDVDISSPEVEITSIAPGTRLQVPPDSLYGWAWDMFDVVGMEVRYRQTAAWQPLPSTVVMRDTVFFAALLADSLVEGVPLSIGVRATDRVGRQGVKQITVTWDTTAPPEPVLYQPKSPTPNPILILDGNVDDELVDSLRIFQNGVLIDTIDPERREFFPEFPYPMTLAPGENQIFAKSLDVAGNESKQSNTIVVVLDVTTGLAIEQPFKSGDSFVLYLSKPATHATLRIYDLGGRLVDVLSIYKTDSTLLLQWDGRNGDGDTVHKGPLVAVVEVFYQSGETEIFRESFLFQP